MIDIDAPIVPGKSAAGFSIGAFVGESLAADRPRSTIKLPRFDDVAARLVMLGTNEAVLVRIVE
jgi:hypothetical protein